MIKLSPFRLTILLVALLAAIGISCTLWGAAEVDEIQPSQPIVNSDSRTGVSEAVVDTKSQETDYIWIDYYKLQEDRYWSRVSEDGQALYVQFGVPGTNELEAVRAGTLSSEEVSQLFDLFEKVGFFNLASKYPTDDSVVYEGDLLAVFAHIDGKSHQVSARPPGFSPKGLTEIVEFVEGKIPTLEPQSDQELFVRAEVVTPDRAERLKDRGQRFISFSQEELQEHPSVKAAIKRPNELISLGPQEFQKISQYLTDKSYFFVSTSDGKFQVEAFSFNKRGK
jgi:hypothetical protein